MSTLIAAIDLNTAAGITQVGSVLVAGFAGVFQMWRKIDKRQQNLESSSMRLEDRLERIEHQFGPNGGGLREAVNNMSQTMLKIDERMTKMGDEVANLSGKFQQHIVEGNRNADNK